MEIADITLTLFLSRGVGLKTWANVGNIDRELAIYIKLAMRLKKVNMVTYGGNEDKNYSKKLGNITILPVTWQIGVNTRRHLMKYYSEIKNSDLLKTNQILQGSEIPLWFKQKLRKKLIVRCGFLNSRIKSLSARFTKNPFIRAINLVKIKDAIQLEKNAFTLADMGIVTSAWQRQTVINQYKLNPAKIKVIPNYVVTDIFKPEYRIQTKYDLIFVGRGGFEKNIENLLKAIHHLKIKKRKVALVMVGSCCNNRKIRKTINKFGLDVTLKGTVPSFELPKVINQARIFILPSYFEHHPKALLEAMSCGMACIGADVTGIREDIQHLTTGYLCKTDSRSIAEAIETLLSDETLQTKLGRNARNYILERYSLDRVFQMELAAIKEVLAL